MGGNNKFFQVVAESISPVGSAVIKFYFTNSKLTNIFQFSKSRGFKALLSLPTPMQTRIIMQAYTYGKPCSKCSSKCDIILETNR